MIKSRFCPSPTGLIHLGNARTALFNYLFAKKKHGTFLLRIEDTDVERSKPGYTTAVQHDLKWLGWVWTEGPEVSQQEDNGPYHQSKRQSIYSDYYNRLLAAGQAYPCFCSERELVLSRKIQRSSGKPPRYAGTCRHLSAEAVKQKRDQGLKPTLRFLVEPDSKIVFTDLVRGEQTFYGSDIGDFIIRRANGTSPFLFCNAIDDALMGVTHVLRGEDHLTNTPRQMMILNALSLLPPQYAHISLITGTDNTPLSKRNGSQSIQDIRKQGYLPDAINNYLARLGHHYEDDQLMTATQLAENFKLESLSKSPAKFDLQQLNYWQRKVLEKMSLTEFQLWVDENTLAIIPDGKLSLFLKTIKPNVVLWDDVKLWINRCFGAALDFSEAGKQLLQAAGTSYFDEAMTAFKECGKDLEAVIAHLKQRLQIKGKNLFQPLRMALTGQLHGPELSPLIDLMSDELIQQRLKEAQR